MLWSISVAMRVVGGRRFVAIVSELGWLASTWSVMLTPKEETSWESGTTTERIILSRDFLRSRWWMNDIYCKCDAR